ncbi:uncharacterized protein MKK02DRAFT_31441 [Dioszegia hungarica]|uniref:Uncharacterized protein n=1 Tax=Dioszegia hungarica TaxID=4972 RepID=A0AA38HEL4_9TREE|nr:uncharacterized protein MKK02DRAFT_31441 [Dioszegia hungarica]KAI9637894.1 hypothetical protein MKK02DRAFT_31441 [Dioszegia hungarica]
MTSHYSEIVSSCDPIIELLQLEAGAVCEMNGAEDGGMKHYGRRAEAIRKRWKNTMNLLDAESTKREWLVGADDCTVEELTDCFPAYDTAAYTSAAAAQLQAIYRQLTGMIAREVYRPCVVRSASIEKSHAKDDIPRLGQSMVGGLDVLDSHLITAAATFAESLQEWKTDLTSNPVMYDFDREPYHHGVFRDALAYFAASQSNQTLRRADFYGKWPKRVQD